LDAHPEEKQEQIKRFMNAPQYSKTKPNLPEKNVINLDTGLLYTGNGSYFVTLHKPCGKAWQKNPDFILPKSSFDTSQRASKVVEIMDFEFWHNIEEMITLPKLYAEKGISCLVLDAKRCYKASDLAEVKIQIEEFLYSFL